MAGYFEPKMELEEGEKEMEDVEKKEVLNFAVSRVEIKR